MTDKKMQRAQLRQAYEAGNLGEATFHTLSAALDVPVTTACELIGSGGMD